MIIAAAHHPVAQPFNGLYYATTSTAVPVL